MATNNNNNNNSTGTQPEQGSGVTTANPSTGLLQGVSLELINMGTAKDWYTTDLSPSAEMRDDGCLLAAAQADATLRNCTVDDYLAELKTKMTALLGTGAVFDRESLRVKIKAKASEMGSLTFLTGSRSIGKTRLLVEIAKEYKEPDNDVMLVYVNGREGTVGDGIKVALKELKDKKWYDLVDLKRLGSVVESTNPATAAKVGTVACGLSHIFSLLGSDDDKDAKLVGLIDALAKEKKKMPCLIIDEANKVAKAGIDNALLARIILLTKEKMNLSVILCTSVHSYPDTMADALNIEFATSTYIEEFPPGLMTRILTEEAVLENGHPNKVLGMGPNLARLCVSSCGGNLTRVNLLLQELREKKKRCTPLKNVYIRLEGKAAIAELMKEAGCKAAIIALAKSGFWDMSQDTGGVEEKLVAKGVASKVQAADLMEGSPFIEGYPDSFLVPSSQSLRVYVVETYPDEFK